jgi:hypothetical protein
VSNRLLDGPEMKLWQVMGEIRIGSKTSSENTVPTFSALTTVQPCGLFGVPRGNQVHCWARAFRYGLCGLKCHLNILEMECSVLVWVAHSPNGLCAFKVA